MPTVVLAILVLSESVGYVAGSLILAAMLPGWYALWTFGVKAPASPMAGTSQPGRPKSLLSPYAQSIIDIVPDALVIVDDDRRIIEANKAARDLFGVRLIDRDFSQILRHPQAVTAMNEVMRDQGHRQHEIKILSPGERHFILTAVSTEIGQQIARDNEGAINAVAVALHEVTALKRSEQMRADFVANASHELRTPLASLIGFIETLQEHAQEDPEARARFLAIMSQESSRMARLIDDLLSLSRIELDEHVSPSNVVNAGAIIRGVAQTLQMKADDATVKIELGLENADIEVIADSDQLTQIFQNLIDNAIKYGRRGGVVQITSRSVSRLSQTAGPAVAFEIFNEGEGISREHLPRLTDRFYRVDAARSRELGGTGLGLAIVKHIVNRHRGRLVFESELGVGTKVTVTLPSPDAGSTPQSTPITAA